MDSQPIEVETFTEWRVIRHADGTIPSQNITTMRADTAEELKATGAQLTSRQVIIVRPPWTDQSRPARSALSEALHRLGNHMATDPRDWATDSTDAWLYGLFCGWGCERDHEHDSVCSSDDAMAEVAARHRWSSETVARLRRYRSVIKALQEAP